MIGLLWALLGGAAAAGLEVEHAAQPIYPPAAVADRVTGAVVVRIQVDGSGAVVGAEIVQGLREDVDAAALVAANELRFRLPPEAATGGVLDYAFTFALDVQDQQGNAVPGSIGLTFVDPDGLVVPGTRVVLIHAESGASRSLVAGEDGRLSAAFLDPGIWHVSIDHAGFAHASVDVEILPGETRQATFTLVPAGPSESVVVIGLRQRWREVGRAVREPVEEPVTGSYQLTRRDVESTPGALEDVTRAVHKLPGVASDGDMLGTFAVRGATAGETVFLLDRVPLDNPFHLAGFNSIFNPDMLERVDFFASAAPSPYPDGTSAVMDVHSWDGSGKDDRHDLDGAIDVSMSTARLLLMGPLGKEGTPGDPTFALAARRSYIEGYFAVMKAVNLFDKAVAAPEYDELSARLAWRPGPHRFLLTAMRTSDHLALIDSEDDSIVTIDGSFALDDEVYLVSLDHTLTLGEGAELRSTAAYTLDLSRMERSFGGTVNRDVTRHQGLARTDLVLPVGKGHTLRLGALGDVRRYLLDGPVEDTRLDPTWAAAPIADRGFALVDLGDQPWRSTIAGYADHRWDGPVRTRAGVRVTGVPRTGEVLVSPTAGLSVPLPTATVPKVSAGLYHHLVEDPLVIDPVYGNPDIRAERAAQVVVGLDQGVPLWKGGLLRVEGYYSKLDHLVVNYDAADPARDAPAFQNVGTGHNAGVDALLALQTERLSLAATGSYLHARRTNPLNTVFDQTIMPSQAQTWTAGASLEWQAAPKWRFTARYDYHSGRPMSAVTAQAGDTVALSSLNDLRLGDFHQLDLRAEWRKATAKLRWSVYLEVLNVLYLQSDFLPIVSVEDGEVSTTMLSHLPTRPFLGVRADF